MERRQAIVTAIDAERHLALAELEGLTVRVSDSFGLAACALDASGDYEECEAADEAAITALEAEALHARHRLSTLKGEIALMDDLRARVPA